MIYNRLKNTISCVLLANKHLIIVLKTVHLISIGLILRKLSLNKIITFNKLKEEEIAIEDRRKKDVLNLIKQYSLIELIL